MASKKHHEAHRTARRSRHPEVSPTEPLGGLLPMEEAPSSEHQDPLAGSGPTQERETVLPAPLVRVPLAEWHLLGEAVVGLAHRRLGLPCQDRVAYRPSPRPLLALSDGAGSAAVSELGAEALTTGILRFLSSIESWMAGVLDREESEHEGVLAGWILRHAQGLLADLAQAHRRPVRDLRATLQVVVLGEKRFFWWQVGDGVLVVRGRQGMSPLGSTALTKGEFANQTVFVDSAEAGDVQWGILPVADVQGIALMSDGGGERLVAHDGSRVADRLGRWFDEVAAQTLTSEQITLAYHEPCMFARTTRDDRSIVLAARKVERKTPQPQEELETNHPTGGEVNETV